jgi:bifunctional non-homologous end joining protein LigD
MRGAPGRDGIIKPLAQFGAHLSQLRGQSRPTSPLTKPIKKRDTTWIEPRYDAEVMYADTTDDGMVRHPSFKRLVT